MLSSLKVLKPGDDGFVDFSKAVVVTSAKQTGAVTVVVTANSKRLVLGSEIMEKLEDPEAVLVRMKESCVGVTSVAPSTPGALKVRKGSVIYCTEAAQKVADALGVKLPETGSIRMGQSRYQQSEGDNVTAVVSNPSSTGTE